MDMFLGPEPTTASYEFWRDDRPANLALLRELLEAVVTGRYQQTVETSKRGSITVTGRFDLASGEHTHEESTKPSSAVKSGEKYTLRFEPYQVTSSPGRACGKDPEIGAEKGLQRLLEEVSEALGRTLGARISPDRWFGAGRPG